MTDQALDDLFRQVLLDAAVQEESELLEALPGHNFSPKFERKMKSLISRADHPIRHRIVQTAACFILAIVLLGGSVLTFSAEAREALIGWIKELQHEWLSYHYIGYAEAAPENTVYCPTWLPEGYQEIMAPSLGTFVHALYENEDGSRVSYSYQVGLERVTFHVEWEDAKVREAAVNGFPAELYMNTASGPNVLVWTDDGNGIVYWIAGQLSEDELVRVAESVQVSAPLDWVFRPTWIPGGYFVSVSDEQGGKGRTVYETNEEMPIEFCYSKSGVTPYSDRNDGESVTIGENPGTWYPADQFGVEQALSWKDPDTGYGFWLVSPISQTDMLRIAESVEIYLNNLSGAFDDIQTFDPETDPICQEVEQALTDEFMSRVREFARRDAEVGIYMQDDYSEMVANYQQEHLSPKRHRAMERMSTLIDGFTPKNDSGSEHILCLVEPFYFANIYASYHNTTAHIYDETGTMIAGYNRSDGWFPIPTFAEMQFQYEATQIYYEAYKEAKAKTDIKE